MGRTEMCSSQSLQTSVDVVITILQDEKLCSLIDRYQYFRRDFYLWL